MRGITAAVVVTSASIAVTAQSPLRVGALNLVDASSIAVIDTDKVQGQPSRLAWSPDGREIYVQMMEGQFGRTPGRLTHLVFTLESGKRSEA